MEKFHKIVAPTVQELFMQEMLSFFLSDNFGPGEKLPSERALSERMGVSKTVVQNGLQELKRMGFVTIKLHQGVYTADYIKDGNLDTFSAIVHYFSSQQSAVSSQQSAVSSQQSAVSSQQMKA